MRPEYFPTDCLVATAGWPFRLFTRQPAVCLRKPRTMKLPFITTFFRHAAIAARKIIMPQEPKLLDQADVNGIIESGREARAQLALALGYRDDTELSRELLATLTKEQLAEAREIVVEAHGSSLTHNPCEVGAAIVRSLQNANRPKPRSLAELEALAREWFKAGKWPSDFVHTVSRDIARLEPMPGSAAREWLTSGLQAIACGTDSHVGPRPADPVPADPALLQAGIDAREDGHRAATRAIGQALGLPVETDEQLAAVRAIRSGGPSAAPAVTPPAKVETPMGRFWSGDAVRMS